MAAIKPDADAGLAIAENSQVAPVPGATVSLIFHALIEDVRSEAVELAALFPPRRPQRALLKPVAHFPRTTTSEIEEVAGLIAVWPCVLVEPSRSSERNRESALDLSRAFCQDHNTTKSAKKEQQHPPLTFCVPFLMTCLPAPC